MRNINDQLHEKISEFEEKERASERNI